VPFKIARLQQTGFDERAARKICGCRGESRQQTEAALLAGKLSRAGPAISIQKRNEAASLSRNFLGGSISP